MIADCMADVAGNKGVAKNGRGNGGGGVVAVASGKAKGKRSIYTSGDGRRQLL